MDANRHDKIRVIYIAGSPRGGSTLLARLLGHVDGVMALGEVVSLWLTTFPNNLPCSCDVAINECEFWPRVAADAFSGDAPAILRAPPYSMRQLLDHIFPALSPSFQKRMAAYGEAQVKLFESIRKISGATTFVDSSKGTGPALAMATQDRIELHVVHLVRDPRAVRFSQTRRIRWRGVDGQVGRSRPLLRFVSRWSIFNAAPWLLRKRARSFMRVRYEDLAARPRPTVERILRAAGVEGSTDFIGDGYAEFDGIEHIVESSSSKFNRGRVPIRLDDEWERSMPFYEKLLITALTLPLVKLFGY